MIQTYRKLLDLLAPRERRQFYLLLVMIVGMGILQMLTVASILPLMFVLQNPAVIETNALLSEVYSALGFTSHQSFMLALAFGVAAAVPDRDPLVHGLGLVALIALAPIISVMLLGLIVRLKSAPSEVDP